MIGLSLPEITVAIATMGAGAHALSLPAPVAGLRYLVMVQQPTAPMPACPRDDVVFVPLDGLGLSNSRNAALNACETPFAVFADDDMPLDTDGLRALACALEEDPQLSFAAGWRAEKIPVTGTRAGRYTLHKLNAGRICAPELMIRIEAVRTAGVTFDTDFGVGAAHPVGEDYIFVCDMLDAGLRGAGFAVVTGAHPGKSTGDIWSDPVILRARRTVLTRCFGTAAPLIRAAYALRHRKRLGGLLGAWQFWAGSI